MNDRTNEEMGRMGIRMLQQEWEPTNAKNGTHTGTRMGTAESHVGDDIQLIRQQDAIAKIIQEEPETETWLNQEYDEQGIGRELRNLESRKSHGGDVIPGEEYKAPRNGHWGP